MPDDIIGQIDDLIDSASPDKSVVFESNRNGNKKIYFEENRKLLDVFEKFHDEYRKDCTVNYATVGDVVMRVPAIKQKWVSRLCRYRNSLADAEKQLKISIDEQVKDTIASSKVAITKAAAQKAVSNGDSKVIKVLQERIDILGRICEDLDQILKHVHFLNTEMATIVEMIKLENS